MLYPTTIFVVGCQPFFDALWVYVGAVECEVNWASGGLHDVLSLFIFLLEFKTLDDLEHRFPQVCGLVLPVFLDCWYQSRVVGSNIHHHSGLELHFGALASVRGGTGQEANDFVESGLVLSCVIVHVLEVGQFFICGFVDNPWDAHRIDLLETFLEGISSFLRVFFFDDWLMLIRTSLDIIPTALLIVKLYFSSSCIMAFMRMFCLSYTLVNLFPIRFSRIDSIVDLSLQVIIHLHPCCQSSLIAYDFYLGLSAELLRMRRSCFLVSFVRHFCKSLTEF